MIINYSPHFLRSAKKLTRKEQVLLSERIELFKIDVSHPKLKTHALTGRLKGMFAFSVTYSKRAVFVYVDKETVLFVDVGSHGQVYR